MCTRNWSDYGRCHGVRCTIHCKFFVLDNVYLLVCQKACLLYIHDEHIVSELYNTYHPLRCVDDDFVLSRALLEHSRRLVHLIRIPPTNNNNNSKVIMVVSWKDGHWNLTLPLPVAYPPSFVLYLYLLVRYLHYLYTFVKCLSDY